MRYGFNKPPIWSLEMCQFLLGGFFILGGGYTLLREGHVRMDVLYVGWSPRTRAIVDIATFSLVAAYMVILIIPSMANLINCIEMGEKSRSVWQPYLWPIKMSIPAGCIFILLQAIAFSIRAVFVIRGREMKIE